MAIRSKTYVRRLKSVLSDTDPEISALIARMSVAFEDLRIEFYGARVKEKLEPLDVLDPIYRKFYFLRRSTVTVVEFMGSFQLLDRLAEFAPVRRQFEPGLAQEWEAASVFFSAQKEFLKKIRNDYGGHFQLSTARAVLREVHNDLVAHVEISYNVAEHTATPRLHYAYPIVALAFDTHRPRDCDIAEHAGQLFETLAQAWGHCTNVMHALTKHVILPRFRG